MSVLRKYFGFEKAEAVINEPITLTLEERLGEAAADRGWAFGLIEDAKEALKDSAQTEYEVAQELLRRAENAVAFAEDSARRILETGRASAAEKEEKATLSQRNADDDYAAYTSLDDLLAREDLVTDGA